MSSLVANFFRQTTILNMGATDESRPNTVANVSDSSVKDALERPDIPVKYNGRSIGKIERESYDFSRVPMFSPPIMTAQCPFCKTLCIIDGGGCEHWDGRSWVKDPSARYREISGISNAYGIPSKYLDNASGVSAQITEAENARRFAYYTNKKDEILPPAGYATWDEFIQKTLYSVDSERYLYTSNYGLAKEMEWRRMQYFDRKMAFDRLGPGEGDNDMIKELDKLKRLAGL